MNKSPKNSKESSSKEIGKSVKEAEGKKPNKDKLNKAKGSKSQNGSSVGFSLVGRIPVSKAKKLNISQDPTHDYDSDADKDWMNYLKRRAFHPEEF